MSITVWTGVGYGLGLTFPELTAKGLRATADATGYVTVWAYYPGAGHPMDAFNAEVLEGAVESGAWGSVQSWTDRMRTYSVRINDLDGLRKAAELLTRLQQDGVETLDDDQWPAYLRRHLDMLLEWAASTYAIDPELLSEYVKEQQESGEEWYTLDSSGVDLTDDVYDLARLLGEDMP